MGDNRVATRFGDSDATSEKSGFVPVAAHSGSVVIAMTFVGVDPADAEAATRNAADKVHHNPSRTLKEICPAKGRSPETARVSNWYVRRQRLRPGHQLCGSSVSCQAMAEQSPEAPRRYGVGWACRDGSAAGSVALTTPHAWLDSATIEAKLGPVLTARLGSPVTLASAAAGESNPVVRLAMAGHRVVDSDLALNYGLDVVGAVVAELRGRGVWALVVVDRYLSTPVRLSVAHWAEAALDSFRLASESDWLDDGWHQVATGRWQLLASQVGHRTPRP